MFTRHEEIGGFTLELAVSQGQGPTLFMLHGNSSSLNTYSALMKSSLAQEFRLVAVNWPGHGGSSLPPDEEISIPVLGGLVVELASMFARGAYAVVGHSVGGHAASHAVQRLEDCRGLVLISAPPVSVDTLAAAFRPDPCGGGIFRDDLKDSDIAAMCAALLGDAAADGERADQLVRDIRGTAGAFRIGLGRSLARGQLVDEYQAVCEANVPTALVWGEEDAFIYPSFYAEMYLQRPLGAGKYPFAGAGHSPHLSDAVRFESTLRGLLKDAGLQG